MMKLFAHMTLVFLKAVERPMGRSRAVDGRPRGVALLMALVTTALLSSMVVEHTYQARVHLSMATNTRDKIKSYYLARSAVNISRLMILFQFALTQESKETDDQMGQLINRAMQRSNFQMYQYVDLLLRPFNSGKIESPIGGLDLSGSGVEGFGNFTGEFDIKITPESGRININDFAKAELDQAALTAVCSMFIDSQYDDMFMRKDESGELMDRARVIQNMVDFLDPNQEAMRIDAECLPQGAAGDERRPYDRKNSSKGRVLPRNAKLTHVEDIYQIHGMTGELVDAFRDRLTVYDIGKPNINVATAPVFYSVLCQSVMLPGAQDAKGYMLCARNPQIALQVMWFALALDGIREFFSNPMTVLMAYVGSQQAQLLPSAKKGQPVAFLSVSQLPTYLNDLKNDPLLMAQFLQYSPSYMQLVLRNPQLAIDPLAPRFGPWTIDFDRGTLTRLVSAATPEVYRFVATGRYGSTEAKIETVIDFNKTARRLPNERQLAEQESDPEEVRNLKAQLRAQRQQMVRGRVLYWREY
jgi:type II secretory pathway component PulK